MDIKKLRLENKLTMRGLADIAGVSRMTIHRWERGLTKPHANHIEKLQTNLKGRKI